jgi:dTDP-glucose 4,6-dehydratase
VNLLVTGGAGFVGSNYIRSHLNARPDDRIVNLDLVTYAGDPRSLSDVERSAGDRYRFLQGDIHDRELVTEILRAERIDAVINFAAESHNSRAVLDPTRFVRTNVVGTQELLEATRIAGVARFHHISTCEVYGDLALDSPARFTETSPYRPRTPYSASKASADLIVRAYSETFKLEITISNCSNNYGPCQFPEKVIPLFITNALDDRPLPIYRQSANRREWLHVADHCRAIDLVLERGRPGQTYNVGSGDERSIEEVADAVLAATDKPASLKSHVDDRPGHDRRYLLDHSKLTLELGWEPTIAFPDGLRATVDWYRKNRAWWEPKRALVVDESSWRTAIT